jgi:DNA-binding CsgD family transcriptional regulator
VIRGRERELAALRDAVQLAEAGGSAVVLVEGDPGIGKTRLLQEIVAEADDGLRVFVGRGYELEWARPFGALVEALDCSVRSTHPARAAIGRLISGKGAGRQGAAPGLQYRIVDAIVDLVEEEALGGPVLIAIDDLQWADPSTLLALRVLARRAAFLPVVLLVSLRPSPRTIELTNLVAALGADGAKKVLLTSLSPGAVEELVKDLLGVPPGPELVASLARADGNPLFVIELVDGLRKRADIRETNGLAHVSEVLVPPDLRQTILRSVDFLNDDTLATLRGAAILGSVFSVDDLLAVAGTDAGRLALALEEAIRAGILAEAASGQLRFRHDLIRDAIYEDIPGPVRAVLHRAAADKLVAAGAPAVRVAEQHRRAGASRGSLAFDWLVRAARETGTTSPLAAAGLLEEAIEIAGPAHGEVPGLQIERAERLFWGGRVTESEAAFRTTALTPDVDPHVASLARRGLAQVLIAQGRAEAAAEEFDAAAAAPGLTLSERAYLSAWSAHPRLFTGDLEAAQARASAALADGDDLTRCIALSALSMVAELGGQFSEAVILAGEAVGVADRSPDRAAHRFQVGVFHGLFLCDLDRLDESVATLRHGLQISERLGARWNLPLYQVGLILTQFLAGNWDDALAEFDTTVELTSETGTRHAMACNNAVRAMIAMHRDDMAAARSAVALAEEELAHTGPQYRFDWVLWARALLLEADGDPSAAYRTLVEAWDHCSAAGMKSELPVLAPDLARLAALTGAGEHASEVAATVSALASSDPSPWLAGVARRCEAFAADDIALSMAAADHARVSPRPLDRASTLEQAAAALARAGRASEARALLDEALVLYERLGANRDIARVAATLRLLGVRRGIRGVRSRPRTGWQSLTDTERRVVELVVEGLSNPRIGERLFISPRTVQTHLAHVFGKLGISSRVELAAAAVRQPSF